MSTPIIQDGWELTEAGFRKAVPVEPAKPASQPSQTATAWLERLRRVKAELEKKPGGAQLGQCLPGYEHRPYDTFNGLD